MAEPIKVEIDKNGVARVKLVVEFTFPELKKLNWIEGELMAGALDRMVMDTLGKFFGEMAEKTKEYRVLVQLSQEEDDED